jgi:hypothetical protein
MKTIYLICEIISGIVALWASAHIVAPRDLAFDITILSVTVMGLFVGMILATPKNNPQTIT